LAENPANDLVWQFPNSVAFLGSWQRWTGYCVLVSRTHAAELSQLPDDERSDFLNEMCILAQAIEATFQPKKMNYELLGNQVPHLHWHLFPRYADDRDPARPVWFAIDADEKDPVRRKTLEGGRISSAESITRLRCELSRLTGDPP
jgi:diadenosine tetraphosphate (Ap4A) HIT family hydrolase